MTVFWANLLQEHHATRSPFPQVSMVWFIEDTEPAGGHCWEGISYSGTDTVPSLKIASNYRCWAANLPMNSICFLRLASAGNFWVIAGGLVIWCTPEMITPYSYLFSGELPSSKEEPCLPKPAPVTDMGAEAKAFPCGVLHITSLGWDRSQSELRLLFTCKHQQ